ncbi:MAG: methylated-DNA--[protein]-cysteine S-methyltransferase [Firmicutes bacterium]|nr:methylated-DNA--[protein]-cysteine S-methyltransferase [Candidatus Fermentithermobacillaceae bacterium]
MISQIVMSPIGFLRLTVEDGRVTGLEFVRGADRMNRTTSTSFTGPSARPSRGSSRGPSAHLPRGLSGGPSAGQSVCLSSGPSTGPRVVPLHTESSADGNERDRNALAQAIQELDAYFAGRLRNFSVPIRLTGTRFQQSVWDALRQIGCGETKTYRDVAMAVGSPGAARAVGNACAATPVAIIVPCHRVVAQTGLGGFGGGLDTKRWLLELESRHT